MNNGNKMGIRVFVTVAFCLTYSDGEVKDVGIATKPSVSVGFIWESPRLEQHNVKQVDVELKHTDLRLICQIKPALPKTKSNFLARDDIVQWNKMSRIVKHKLSNIYWSDDQSITAVSFKKLRTRDLGLYSCSFFEVESVINVTAKSIADIAHLPDPENHEDLEGMVLNLEDTSGLKHDIKKQMSDTFQKDRGRLKTLSCQSSARDGSENALSVHGLKPEDIKIVAAVTGSMLAGVGSQAVNVLDLFTAKGKSIFRMDSNNSYYGSFPNIMKKFATGIRVVQLPHQDSKLCYEMSINQIGTQVEELISAMKGDKMIDYGKDWKLITVSLDYDDFCYACLFKKWEDRLNNVRIALDRLQSQVPRAFVNLLLPPNILMLTRHRRNGNCSALYRKKCFCMEKDEDSSRQVLKMVIDFREYLLHLVEKSNRYNSKDDFTVVIQPVWSDNISVKEEVLQKIFAPDCYHLSSYGHECLSAALWNNMLQPVHNKTKECRMDQDLRCPTKERPFFFTAVNSPRKFAALTEDQQSVTASSSSSSSSPGNRVGLGVGIAFVMLVIIMVLILYNLRRRRPVSPSIRILATPWRRLKEKV